MAERRFFMKYAIVTDSSCDLKSLPSSHNNTIYLQAPLSLRIGNREFIDDENVWVRASSKLDALAKVKEEYPRASEYTLIKSE